MVILDQIMAAEDTTWSWETPEAMECNQVSIARSPRLTME